MSYSLRYLPPERVSVLKLYSAVVDPALLVAFTLTTYFMSGQSPTTANMSRACTSLPTENYKTGFNATFYIMDSYDGKHQQLCKGNLRYLTFKQGVNC